MRIVVPYTVLDGRATAALGRFTTPGQVEYVNVSAHEESYADLMRDLWTAGESFTVIEHDMEIHAHVLSQFEACGELWCVFPYTGKPYKNYPIPVLRMALGCTRFHADLMLENIGLIDDLDVLHWRRLDSQLATALLRRGYSPHEHEPHVIHHHDYSKR